MPAHRPNESIEGEKISGDSRDPVRFQRIQRLSGRKCYIFKVEFNVHAEISVPLTSATKIDEKALTGPGEKLSSDTAVITSFCQKFSSTLKSNFTSTHSVNIWDFAKQTNVKVITPRQQIINAMQRRLDTQPAAL
jgi:hypothetical protein